MTTTNFATPNLSQFNPHLIPLQFEIIKQVRNFDYSKGVLELLLSGSIGSAKSILMAHLALTHVLGNARARFMLGRRSMPDLKDTLIKKIDEHLEGVLIKGKDYDKNDSTGYYHFKNGSEMISRSWADKNFTRFQSLELSGAAVEELTENDGEYFDAIKMIRSRIGRLSHVKENFMVGATNPGSPSHPAYKYYIEGESHFRRVYYSKTTDNPFLPKWYIEQLYDVYDQQEVRRFIFGEWVDIRSNMIYHSYDEEISLIDDYNVDPLIPICMTFDFNIGIGKPLSIAFFQRDGKKFYFFDEVIVDRCITEDAVGEAIERGIITTSDKVIIHGDATGRARSTQAKHSNYEQINQLLSDAKIRFEIDVPLTNSPIRKRHMIVNGLLKNGKGETSIFITKKCKTLREGFRMSKLKKGAEYTEDDSDYFQHVTTAAGYGIMAQLDKLEIGKRYNQLRY